MHTVALYIYLSEVFASMQRLVCDDEGHSLLPPPLIEDVNGHPFAFVEKMVPVSVFPLDRYTVKIWIYVAFPFSLHSKAPW